MADIMAEAVEAIEKKLAGYVFDGSAKFEIQDESIANYRSYIGQKKLGPLRKSINKLSL